MAYRVSLSKDVKADVAGFSGTLQREWLNRLSEIILNPLPHAGEDFEIIVLTNQFGDTFLALVVDEFSFTIHYDVYPWDDAENPFDYEGVIHIFRLAT